MSVVSVEFTLRSEFSAISSGNEMPELHLNLHEAYFCKVKMQIYILLMRVSVYQYNASACPPIMHFEY
jgi:hypothetical protein